MAEPKYLTRKQKGSNADADPTARPRRRSKLKLLTVSVYTVIGIACGYGLYQFRTTKRIRQWNTFGNPRLLFANISNPMHKIPKLVSFKSDTSRIKTVQFPKGTTQEIHSSGTNKNTRPNSVPEVPDKIGHDNDSKNGIDWLEKASAAMSALIASHEGVFQIQQDGAPFPEKIQVRTDGLVLLPALAVYPTENTKQISSESVPATETIQRTAGYNQSNTTATEDSIKLSSSGIARRSTSATADKSAQPAYLRAAAIYAAPRLTSEQLLAQLEERSSIFEARRKGSWMGCSRPHYLVCKGVYRAIKRTNALTILDTACAANAYWLPLVLKHLAKELRSVKLTCADSDENTLHRVRPAYKDIKHVEFVQLDPYNAVVPNKTDLLIAISSLNKDTLIRAMKFFRNIERSGNVAHIIYENFPDSNNGRGSLPNQRSSSKLNTFAPPFMFGTPTYYYENADEQPTTESVMIVTMNIIDLFKYSRTPTMLELKPVKPSQQSAKQRSNGTIQIGDNDAQSGSKTQI